MALLAAVAAMALVVAANAKPIIVKSGNLEVTFEGGATPKALPKKGSAPITLTLAGKIATTDGTHVPAAETISLDFDKAGSLITKGLPSCSVGDLESTLTAQAKSVCASSLIGTGTVTADIALPEQAPFGASGPLLIFNGSKGNKQSLILHVYAKVPAPTTFVVPVAISKAHGKFGTNAFIKVPKIVSGAGSVTSFKAKIAKKFNVGSKKYSVINAGCPTGSLFAHGDFKFVGGAKLSGDITVPCTPKG